MENEHHLSDNFEDPFEDIFEIRLANMRSNRRLYKILEQIKSKSFVDSVKNLLKETDGIPQIRVSRKPLGFCLKDNRWSAIPEIWIDQKQTDQGPEGYLYVQVKEKRWLMIHFDLRR